MAYKRVNWENLPSTNTPVNADNLNKMDEGIANADTKINAKQDKLTAGTGIEITGKNIINNLNANYSTNEQVVGKWIDGKPLYRKVYKSREFSNKYNIPMNNVDNLVDINGMVKRSDYNIYCKIPYRTGEATWNTSFGNISITNDHIEINMSYGSNFSASAFSNIVITVKYTKTTD